MQMSLKGEENSFKYLHTFAVLPLLVEFCFAVQYLFILFDPFDHFDCNCVG